MQSALEGDAARDARVFANSIHQVAEGLRRIVPVVDATAHPRQKETSATQTVLQNVECGDVAPRNLHFEQGVIPTAVEGFSQAG